MSPLPKPNVRKLLARLNFTPEGDGIYCLYNDAGHPRLSFERYYDDYIITQYTGTRFQRSQWDAVIPVKIPLEPLEAFLIRLTAA